MTHQDVRVRFAPSPTGSLHIGGARTALFNWLFAKRHGGKFILRIEDTDQARSVPGSVEELMAGLRWLGLEWDEGPDKGGPLGPYIQSQRLELYQQWAQYLLDQGQAYRCYATPEELKRAKEIAEKSKGGKIAGYERIYRFISEEERAKVAQERPNHVIRLAMPIGGETVVQDELRGTIRFPNEELSDIVLLKSDGFPTYHLAMAVDDHLMQISHVMRAEEWLPSAPMHTALYQALGWEPPKFVHLPMMVYKGKKISKRNPPLDDSGNKIPVMVRDYMEIGFQAEAVVNWLCNIGWSFGEDREIFPVEEAIARFSIERINPAPTEMPYSKLEFLNGHYVRALSLEAFMAQMTPLLEAAYGPIDQEKLRIIGPHLQERANPLPAGVPIVAFLFAPHFTPPTAEQVIPKGLNAAATKNLLAKLHELLAGLPDFAAATQEGPIRALAAEMNLKAAQVFNPLRWATTGQQIAPPLFESIEALGREATLQRLQLAIAAL